jgi:hypothetical protein
MSQRIGMKIRGSEETAKYFKSLKFTLAIGGILIVYSE